MTQKKFYTIREVCQSYNCSRSYLYLQLKLGKLAAVKVGKKTLIRAEEADNWMSSMSSYISPSNG